MKKMKIRFTRRFEKQYNKSPKKIKKAFNDRLDLFIRNKYHPLLNNHALVGELRNFRSISITGDWRALFQEFENGELIFFEFLGTHSKLYKKFN